ncbi:RNA polymerase sigma-70 factor [Mucilaginibacter sp. SMC90]|uniref:RNA polymerase sigma-70 factor n=1 Tax=Mucilaginibacter sp. SMC90 TaxID=2929803 RepID=UPI001FB4D81F|nr:RNA polymerase sigma-70 factor [Mucilaginibacter sp. SMC90]UOE51331.1 RNA polymerase sigma-70 factor [Mucilaginibacter sp. SMC90]
MAILAFAMLLDDGRYRDEGLFPLNMGEEAAFERTFKAYHAPLRYYCEQLTGADDASEDIVSHLFLKLWQKQVVFENTEHAQAYLYRSAKNACLNFIRNEKRADENKEIILSETPEVSDNYLNTFIQTEVWAELYRAIEGLPSQCCKVITMSYLEGMSNQEIADEMDLSLQTVKNYKLRGLTILKDRLPDGLLILLTSMALLK